MTWQLIDTAPQDGTSILGYADGVFAVVHWYNSPRCNSPLVEIGYWSLDVYGAFAEDSEWTPTHWQPLPAAPGLFENTTPEADD